MSLESKRNKIYKYEKEKFWENHTNRIFVWCSIIFIIIFNIIFLPWNKIFFGQYSLLDCIIMIFRTSIFSLIPSIIISMIVTEIYESSKDDNWN